MTQAAPSSVNNELRLFDTARRSEGKKGTRRQSIFHLLSVMADASPLIAESYNLEGNNFFVSDVLLTIPMKKRVPSPWLVFIKDLLLFFYIYNSPVFRFKV